MSFQLIYVYYFFFFFFLKLFFNKLLQSCFWASLLSKASKEGPSLLGIARIWLRNKRNKLEQKAHRPITWLHFQVSGPKLWATLSSYMTMSAIRPQKNWITIPPPPKKKTRSGLKSKLTKKENKGGRKTHMILCFNF